MGLYEYILPTPYRALGIFALTIFSSVDISRGCVIKPKLATALLLFSSLPGPYNLHQLYSSSLIPCRPQTHQEAQHHGLLTTAHVRHHLRQLPWYRNGRPSIIASFDLAGAPVCPVLQASKRTFPNHRPGSTQRFWIRITYLFTTHLGYLLSTQAHTAFHRPI